MTNKVRYGDSEFSYIVTNSPALTSNVRIHVHPNGRVEVEAPSASSPRLIKEAVQKRARWVIKHLEGASSLRTHVLPRDYRSGETHFYLGRRYQLKIIEARSEPTIVSMKGGLIHVRIPRADTTTIRRRLDTWYRERATEYLQKRLSTIASDISWLKDVPPMKLIPMKKQWGSCTPSGAIHINPHLIKAPRECIDYVITHELCHLREHNHSPRYYRILQKLMPDWGTTKARLDAMAELLLNE